MFNFKKIIYVILHIFIICTLGFSLMIYTSLNTKSPWYESCGTQFLAIFIITLPILLILGIALQFLSKKYIISKSNLLLPFYSLAGLSLPLVIDGRLHGITLLIGSILCIAFIIQTLVLMITNLKNSKNC